MFKLRAATRELNDRISDLEEAMAQMSASLEETRKAVYVARKTAAVTEDSHHKNPGKRAYHSTKHLIYKMDGRIDVDKSAAHIGRSVYEIVASRWPKASAEGRIDHAVRASTPGVGGMLSREAWLSQNQQQLDLFK
jgi:hypothetical protein